jgi:drug/metabolite transporter (DMT)-like permease
MSGQDWLALLFLSLLWGGTFLFVKIAVVEIPPMTLVLSRVLIGATVLLLLLKALGRPLPDPARWRDYLGMGLLNNAIPFTLIFWGQAQIAAGLAAILNAAMPIFTVIVMHVFTMDERATPATLAGVLLGMAGVVLLVGPDALGGLGLAVWAQLACLAATVSYAFSALWARRLRGLDPLDAAAGQLTASTLLMAPLALLIDRPWTLPMPSPTALACVAALGLASTALGYILFFRILKRAGGTNASLVTLLIPPSAILLGFLVLGERLDPLDFAGLAVLALGLAVIDGRALGLLRGPARA